MSQNWFFSDIILLYLSCHLSLHFTDIFIFYVNSKPLQPTYICHSNVVGPKLIRCFSRPFSCQHVASFCLCNVCHWWALFSSQWQYPVPSGNPLDSNKVRTSHLGDYHMMFTHIFRCVSDIYCIYIYNAPVCVCPPPELGEDGQPWEFWWKTFIHPKDPYMAL